MALPLWAIMLMAGAAKEELIDKPSAMRQNLMRAKEQELSPWLGQAQTPFATGRPGESMMQFGMTGAMMEQGAQQMKQQQQLIDANVKLLERQAAMYPGAKSAIGANPQTIDRLPTSGAPWMPPRSSGNTMMGQQGRSIYDFMDPRQGGMMMPMRQGY